MKIRVIETTFCDGVKYVRGDELVVEDAIGIALGTSVEVIDASAKVAAKAYEEPVTDKMVKKSPVKKSTSKRK